MNKTLVIYYSRNGENYVNGNITQLEKGNTEICAEYIKDIVNAVLFKVEELNKYSDDYMECINEAKIELKENARPQLINYLDNIDNYENIIIAGPCWWGTFPMPIFSQIERLDFNNKNVYPLMTHEGSRLGHCEKDLKKYCKGATIKKGLAIKGGMVSSSLNEITSWLKDI